MQAVFLHAFGADRMTWVGTTPALAIEALTPDLPGHGRAVGDLGEVTLADMAARVELGEAEGWLVGHSLGGALALELAATQPERWRGVVLLAPLGLGQGFDPGSMAGYAEIEDAAGIRSFLTSLVVAKGLMTPPVVNYVLSELNKPGMRAAQARIAAGLGELERAAAARAEALTDVEVLTIWGDQDPVARPDRERIKALGDFVELPETGHIPHVERLKEVNALLKERLTP